MDLHAKKLREEFWRNNALNGFPIGKPYKEIEFLFEFTDKQGSICGLSIQFDSVTTRNGRK